MQKLIAILTVCVMLSCAREKVDHPIATPVRTYLDWAGTYVGVVPCPDCEGIETILSVQRSQAYRLMTRALGKSDPSKVNTGKFSWNKDSTIIVLNETDNGPMQFLVGKNVIVQLDKDGKQITGELAEKYRLIRTVESILGLSRWNLAELLGKFFERSAAHIRFDPDAQQINGYGWCNSFNGTYEIHNNNEMKFGEMLSSNKICPDTTIENQLFNVFKVVDSYKLEGTVLTLSRSHGPAMIKFEATPGR